MPNPHSEYRDLRHGGRVSQRLYLGNDFWLVKFGDDWWIQPPAELLRIMQDFGPFESVGEAKKFWEGYGRE